MRRTLSRCLSRSLASAAVLGLALAAQVGGGQAKDLERPVGIAVLNDKSSVFADPGGIGSVWAAELAIEDFGGKVGGHPVKLLAPDHQNKADIGASLARQMYDRENIDALFDIGNSAISLAVNDIARERGKVVVHTGSATADVFGKACAPTSAMWLYDTYSLAKGLGKSVVDQGGKTWYFLTADYAFGHAMQAAVTKVVEAAGGKVLGSVRHPVGVMDYSSFLMQAQASGANIVAFANASGDTVNSLKQAREFQVGQGDQKLGVLIFYLTSVHSLGAEALQGVQYLSGYYWDKDDESRAFAKRYEAKSGGKKPDHNHVAVYSAVKHYLKSVEATGSLDGKTVMRDMKSKPLDDVFSRGATIRPDGRLMNDMLLVEVKKPEEVRNPWDLVKIKQVVKAGDIMRPISEGNCTQLDPAPEAAAAPATDKK